MTRRAGDRNRRKSEDRTFLLLPHAVIDSPGFRRATPAARSLLIDIAAQRCRRRGNGSGSLPNGGLMADRARLLGWGWRSVSGTSAAIRDLVACGLLVVTRQGGRNIPTLYAVTWEPIEAPPETYSLSINRLTWGTVFMGAYLRPDKVEPEVKTDRTSRATAGLRAKRLSERLTLAAPSSGATRGRIAPSDGAGDSPIAPSHGATKAASGDVLAPWDGLSEEGLPSLGARSRVVAETEA